MTLNWGHKLILVFIVFASLMSFLVFKCMRTNYDLVSKDYYKDELAYQQVIDGTGRASKLSAPVSIRQSEENLVVQLPAEMQQQEVTGTLWLYCVADAGKDRKFTLTAGNSGTQSFNTNGLKKGSYIAKLSWQANGVQYYSEQPVTIH